MSQQRTERGRGHYIGGEWTDGNGAERGPAGDRTQPRRRTDVRARTPRPGSRWRLSSAGRWPTSMPPSRPPNRPPRSGAPLSYIDRAEFLWDIYHELRDRHDELGKIVSKKVWQGDFGGKADVTEAWHMVEWAAGNARHPHGDVVPSEIGSKDAYMRRKPRGVVGCITPWNFPVAIPFWHMAIALVEGNTVVWKPAEQTPWWPDHRRDVRGERDP